jgi:hypothetical protein
VVGEGRDDAADGEDGEWRDDGPNWIQDKKARV